MVINVSVQYSGELLPDIILLTLCEYIGEPFQYHVELLSLQPMFPSKPFDGKIRMRSELFFNTACDGATPSGSSVRFIVLDTHGSG